MPIEFKFTPLADAVSRTKYSIEAVTSRALQEIEQEELNVDRLLMHCFGMNDDVDDLREFIIMPHDGALWIDTVTYEDELMDSGPYKGKIVSFPIPDTLDDDD